MGMFDDLMPEQPAPSPVESSPVAPPAKDPKSMGLAEGALETVKNIPSSAVQFGKDLIHPVLHPIETAESLKNLGHGVLQKTGLAEGNDKEGYADAVGKFLYDRYGSMENAKKSIITDPVGVLADLSLVLSGGGTLAARSPGIAGKAASTVANVGAAIDPLSLAARGARAGAGVVGNVAANVVGGVGTQTGALPLQTAYSAGREGGRAQDALIGHMRGTAEMEEPVISAGRAIDHIREERGASYRADMKALGADKTVLNFNDVDKALAEISEVSNFHGQNLRGSTAKMRKQIGQTVAKWKALDPKVFHTPEGLDALKQKLFDLRNETPGSKPNTAERGVVDKVAGALKDTIEKQAPQYAKIMRNYEVASSTLRELEHTLSLPHPEKRKIDTALRKLQSVMRDNVNTNYGRRTDLARYLVENGSPQLMEMLAGQALKSWLPRGLGRAVAGAVLGGGALTGTLGTAVPLLGATSPRLMGEAALKMGQTARGLNHLKELRVPAAGSFQAGREDRITPHPNNPYAP